MTRQHVWLRLRLLMVLGNFIGAIVAFVYFSFLDTSARAGLVTKSLRPGQILYFVAG